MMSATHMFSSTSLEYNYSQHVMIHPVDQIGAGSAVSHANPFTRSAFTCHPIGELSRLFWWRSGRVDILHQLHVTHFSSVMA